MKVGRLVGRLSGTFSCSYGLRAHSEGGLVGQSVAGRLPGNFPCLYGLSANS